MENASNPEVLAVVPLPTAEERRRRETVLARVMLLAVDLVVSGEGLGLEVARDFKSNAERHMVYGNRWKTVHSNRSRE
jgi:hypothetical protein